MRCWCGYLSGAKAVQFAAEVTNRFTALEDAHDEITPEDLWKCTKTVLKWYQLPELIPTNSNSGLHSCISISIHTQHAT